LPVEPAVVDPDSRVFLFELRSSRETGGSPRVGRSFVEGVDAATSGSRTNVVIHGDVAEGLVLKSAWPEKILENFVACLVVVELAWW
jgi:hypothetical protein